MKQKGNTFPGMIGPPPDTNGVNAGIWIRGATRRTPIASAATVPIFMYDDR